LVARVRNLVQAVVVSAHLRNCSGRDVATRV